MKSVIFLSTSRSLKFSSRSLAYLTPKDILPTQAQYNAKLTELRKQWAADYKAEQQRISDEKAAEVKRIILQKAINLRQKRITSAKKAEIQRVRQQKIREHYQAHVARMTVLENQKDEIRKERLQRLIKMHEAESKYWLTKDNIDTKITEELFESPATTGVITEISEYWRYCCPSMQPNRTIVRLGHSESPIDMTPDENRPENHHGLPPGTYMDPFEYLLYNEQKMTIEKENLRATLNLMIGEGSDRAKYESIVQQFVDLTEKLNGPLSDFNYNSSYLTNLPAKKTLTPEEMMQFIDTTDPVVAKKAERDIQEHALTTQADEFKELIEPILPSDKKHLSLQEIFLPKEQEDDSDYEILKGDDDADAHEEKTEKENEKTTAAAASTTASSLFESAESTTFDDLLDDVKYMNENNPNEMKQLYERIKSQIRKEKTK